MKIALALVAVAGLAAAANATITATADVSSNTIGNGQTVTVTIRGAYDNPSGDEFGLANLRATVAVQGGQGGSLARANVGSDDFANDNGDAANVGMWNVFRDLFNPNNNNGAAGNGTVTYPQITGIDGSQNPQANGIEGNPFNGSNGAANVYSFTYTYSGPDDGRTVNILITGSGRGFINAQGSTAARENFANLTVSLRVIPAPASVALLGLGGLVAARRRRA